MGLQMGILIEQMIQFATIVVLGFIIYKIKLVDDDMIDFASTFSVKYFFPVLLFTTVVGGATRSELLTMGPFALAVIICELILLFGAVLFGKIFRFKQPTLNIHIACAAYGNTGFVGLPVALALFPETGALPVAIYMFIDFIFMYSVAPVLSQNKKTEFKKLIKKAVNPITVMAVAGFVLVLIGIRPVNTPVWTALEGIGSASKYIMLSYLGADIARKGILRIFNNKKVFITEALKLLVLPLAAFFAVRAMGLFNYEQSMIVLVMMLSPTMTAMAFYSREGGSDENYAVSAIVAGHIACLATVPLGFYIANMF